MRSHKRDFIVVSVAKVGRDVTCHCVGRLSSLGGCGTTCNDVVVAAKTNVVPAIEADDESPNPPCPDPPLGPCNTAPETPMSERMATDVANN